MTTSSPDTTVSFYFDPGCPWTWLTARWLECVAGGRDLKIDWRSLSLSVLTGHVIEEIPERWRASSELSRASLRLVEALRASDRTAEIGSLYLALGERLFTDGMSPSPELLAASADEAGVADLLSAADDSAWDAAIEQSTNEALELGGEDLGSPILVVDGRGIFGPIISSVPGNEDSLRLWDSLIAVSGMDAFFELKRERTTGPDLYSASAGMVCEIPA